MNRDKWIIKHQQTTYENNWIDVKHYDVVNPSGNDGIYGVVHFKNIAVGILPLDTEMNTYLVGQFRFALNRYSWEIPEGGCPLDEKPEDCAKRELEEETGLKTKQLIPLLNMDLSNSVTNEVAKVFLAQKLKLSQPKFEDTEDITIKKLPFSEAYQMVLKGEITDSISVAAILKTQILIQENQIT